MASGPRTSFQKKSSKASPFSNIPGTKPSLYNYQLLTSSGAPHVDQLLLQGGIPVGSVVLIEEGAEGSFHKVLLKYFLAEGVVNRHGVLSASCEQDFLSNLPEVVASSHQQKSVQESGEQLQIAWRYKDQGKQQPAVNEKSISHHFNLQKVMPKDIVAESKAVEWSPTDGIGQNHYQGLICELQSLLGSDDSLSLQAGSSPKNLLRVGIHSVGSLLWGPDDKNHTNLTRFLLVLRSLVRSHLAVCFITLSQSCEFEQLQRIRESVDFSLSLTPFTKEERTVGAYKDHHGTIQVVKTGSLNSLQSGAVKSKFLFKSLRTKFQVERMHLPPDLAGGPEPTKNKLEF